MESSSTLHELDLMLLQEDKDLPPPAICIVRLSTGTWHDKRGLYQRKTLSFMKRLSSGYQVLREDAGMIGAEKSDGYRSQFKSWLNAAGDSLEWGELSYGIDAKEVA